MCDGRGVRVRFMGYKTLLRSTETYASRLHAHQDKQRNEKKEKRKTEKNSRQCVQLNTHINRVYSTNPKKIVHSQSETCVAARKGRNTN